MELSVEISCIKKIEADYCWPSFYYSDSQPSSPDFFKASFHRSLS